MIFKQFILFFFLSFPLLSDSPAFLVNIGYESPLLIAPALISIYPQQPNKIFQFGMVGWTVLARGEYKIQKNISLGMSFDVTPLNSNGSIYRYENGERDRSLDFENSTFLSQFYVKNKQNRNLTGQINVIILNENVDGLTELGLEEVESIWGKSYFGFSIHESWRNVEYEDFFNNRWDGNKLSGEFQYLTGDNSFYKGSITGGFGKKMNSSNFMISGKVFFSRNLNEVNQFIVGGSWELELLDFLPGSHYGEYRIDEGILINFRIDHSVKPNIDIGFRSGFLSIGNKIHQGFGLKVMTVFHGIVAHFGIGIPGESIRNGDLNTTIISGGITFGVM